MADDFSADVEALLFRHVRVERHAGGKWMAGFEPHSVAGWEDQKLPPGQAVSVGPDDYRVEYAGEVWTQRTPAGVRTLHDLSQWAAYPHFHSRESAVSQMMTWLRDERKDLCEAARQEAIAGRSYRRGT